eukprot:1162056-Pelagomonas_calceolata.AAC.2
MVEGTLYSHLQTQHIHSSLANCSCFFYSCLYPPMCWYTGNRQVICAAWNDEDYKATRCPPDEWQSRWSVHGVQQVWGVPDILPCRVYLRQVGTLYREEFPKPKALLVVLMLIAHYIVLGKGKGKNWATYCWLKSYTLGTVGAVLELFFKNATPCTAFSLISYPRASLHDCSCVLAARSMGPLCESSFLDSTFLSDRVTTVRQHLRANPTIMDELPPPELIGRYSG